MSSFFSSKKNAYQKNNRLILVLDIGSSSVTGSIIFFQKNKQATVIFSCGNIHPQDSQTSLNKKMNAGRMEDSISQSLSIVLSKISSDGYVEIKKHGFSPKEMENVHIFLSSPWHISQTRIFHVHREKRMFVNDRVIKGMMEQEKESFIKSLNQTSFRADDSEAPTISEKFELIENRLMAVTLNGYSTNDPNNKFADSFELDLHFCAVENTFLSKIKETILRTVRVSGVFFHSFPFIAFNEIRESEMGKNWILLLVGDDISDIVIIKNRIMVETITFPAGKNYFIKRLSSALNVVPSIALSSLRTYEDNNAEHSVVSQIETSLKESFNDWQKIFHEALASFSGEYFLPRKYHVSVGTSFAKIFSNFFSQFLSMEKTVQFSEDKISMELSFLSRIVHK
jgi:cell division ATPase FtsA